MPPAFTLYHNPRCSKSRQTLALLQENGVEPEIIAYLEETPTAAQLAQLVKQLDMKPRQLLRKGESAYKKLDLANPELTDKEILGAMAAHPKLIERPIVVKGQRAVLGRPPENVLELL